MLKKAALNIILLSCSVQLVAQSAAIRFNRLMDQGYFHLYRFRPVEAMEKFQAAIQLARQPFDSSNYAKALLGAGQATWYSSNFSNAADTVRLALQYFPANDMVNRIGALRILSNIYDDIGDYGNAFKVVEQTLTLNEGADKENTILSLVQMGRLYKNIGDYETALAYYKKAQNERPGVGEYPFRELNRCLGELYIAKNLPDSANYFYRKAFIGNPTSRSVRLRLGESLLKQHRLDSAFLYLDSLYREAISAKDLNMATGAMIGLGRIALAKGDIKTAIQWAQRSFDIASKSGLFIYKTDATGLLASLYETIGNTGLALYYEKMHTSLKETASSDIYTGQLFAFRQKTQQAEQAAVLRSLEADKKLAKRTILVLGLLAVSIIAIIIFRHNNEKLRLKQRATELEMQALRAQMNPHFIFNCLSAINHFILNNEPDKASDYLTRFSRLVRMVLVNAGKESISLEEELDMLRLYLDMEQLRFKDAFDYTIVLDPGLRPSITQVPCFILQPFCENAIWHGLLHKEGKGRLNISLTIEKHQLVVYIQDNGIGLEKANQFKTRTTESLGQKLTVTRLALFNRGKNGRSHFVIRDMKDADNNTTGTEVILKIKTPLAHD